MTTVFIDSALYIAAVNPRDSLHQKALALMLRHHGKAVTTQFVLLEVANHLSKFPARKLLPSLLNEIQADADTIVVPATALLYKRGLSLLISRTDREWSLTDCISFVVMKESGITEAFAHNHHFEQAGFKPLLM